jgi:hypothetical protein
MTYEKDKYEKLIYASPLFELDKQKQGSAYRKESLKMIEYLYCYLLALNAEKNEPYGCEIVDVATRCINGYDRSRDFLHYFNAAWKKEYAHICGDQIIENKFQGMKLSEQEKREVKKYMRLISRCNPNITDDQKYEKIAELMELPTEKIKAIAQASETKVVGEFVSNSDGEEVGIFDQVSDDFSIEGYFENLSSLVVILDSVEALYKKLQERQKPIVSDMITVKIGLDIFEIEKLSRDYSFVSKEICEEIKRTGVVPTQRNIAEKYRKNEASVSRTVKEFLKKVREEGEELNGIKKFYCKRT